MLLAQSTANQLKRWILKSFYPNLFIICPDFSWYRRFVGGRLGGRSQAEVSHYGSKSQDVPLVPLIGHLSQYCPLIGRVSWALGEASDDCDYDEESLETPRTGNAPRLSAYLCLTCNWCEAVSVRAIIITHHNKMLLFRWRMCSTDNYNYTVFNSIVHIVFNYNFRKMILCYCVKMIHRRIAINLNQHLFVWEQYSSIIFRSNIFLIECIFLQRMTSTRRLYLWHWILINCKDSHDAWCR